MFRHYNYYVGYTNEQLMGAINAVNNGMRAKKAALKWNIPRNLIPNKVQPKRTEKKKCKENFDVGLSKQVEVEKQSIDMKNLPNLPSNSNKNFVFNEKMPPAYSDALNSFSNLAAWKDLFLTGDRQIALDCLCKCVDAIQSSMPQKGLKIIMITSSKELVQSVENALSSLAEHNLIGINDNIPVSFGGPIIFVDAPSNLRMRLSQSNFQNLSDLMAVLVFGDDLLTHKSTANLELNYLIRYILNKRKAGSLQKIVISETGSTESEIVAQNTFASSFFLPKRETNLGNKKDQPNSGQRGKTDFLRKSFNEKSKNDLPSDTPSGTDAEKDTKKQKSSFEESSAKKMKKNALPPGKNKLGEIFKHARNQIDELRKAEYEQLDEAFVAFFEKADGNVKRSYVEEGRILLQDHEAEYKTYREVPDLHPDYEDKYASFVDHFEKTYGKDCKETHIQAAWKHFWDILVVGLKDAEWLVKINELQQTFLDKHNSATSKLTKSLNEEDCIIIDDNHDANNSMLKKSDEGVNDITKKPDPTINGDDSGNKSEVKETLKGNEELQLLSKDTKHTLPNIDKKSFMSSEEEIDFTSMHEGLAFFENKNHTLSRNDNQQSNIDNKSSNLKESIPTNNVNQPLPKQNVEHLLEIKILPVSESLSNIDKGSSSDLNNQSLSKLENAPSSKLDGRPSSKLEKESSHNLKDNFKTNEKLLPTVESRISPFICERSTKSILDSRSSSGHEVISTLSPIRKNQPSHKYEKISPKFDIRQSSKRENIPSFELENKPLSKPESKASSPYGEARLGSKIEPMRPSKMENAPLPKPESKVPIYGEARAGSKIEIIPPAKLSLESKKMRSLALYKLYSQIDKDKPCTDTSSLSYDAVSLPQYGDKSHFTNKSKVPTKSNNDLIISKGEIGPSKHKEDSLFNLSNMSMSTFLRDSFKPVEKNASPAKETLPLKYEGNIFPIPHSSSKFSEIKSFTSGISSQASQNQTSSKANTAEDLRQIYIENCSKLSKASDKTITKHGSSPMLIDVATPIASNVDKYQHKLPGVIKPKISINLSTSSSLQETLNCLGNISFKIGMVGPALKSIVEKSKNHLPNTYKAYKVFTEKDSELLVKIAVNKMESSISSCSPAEKEMYLNTIRLSLKLMDEAKKITSDKAMVPLAGSREVKHSSQTTSNSVDISAIAKATYGFTTEAACGFIKTAFIYKGLAEPSAEEVDRIFKQVSQLQLQQAVKQSTSH